MQNALTYTQPTALKFNGWQAVSGAQTGVRKLDFAVAVFF